MRSFSMRSFLLTLAVVLPMSASDPHLHPLGKSIAPGEIQFTLRGAATTGAPFSVECVYRPYRERDVKQKRGLNLPFGAWAGYSQNKGLISTQRDEFHSWRREFTAPGSDASFTVPLRSPAEGHEAYQLAEVRIVSGPVGTLEFSRWSEKTPELDPGFGLTCTADSLRGTVRPSGLGATPLRGELPLWPPLRTVDLEFSPVDVPVVRLWDSMKKHHWDGWRQATPQFWPGGRSIVLRHVGGPTVWRDHEYYAYPPADAPRIDKPLPPEGVLPGAVVEVFWPEGDVLQFPETRFDQSVDVLAAPLARMAPRFRELLGLSAVLRPGLEMGSLSAAEWGEMDELADMKDLPVAVELAPGADGKTWLKVTRRKLTEPWVFVFAAVYDDDRRAVLTSLVLNPRAWSGPLPE